VPSQTQQQWTFELRKLGNDWKIAGVSAARQ
jgi:hypothetical protein